VPPAASYVRRFADEGRREAARRRVDGVVCGHVHHPALHQEGAHWYANAGDWVENCTALVEHRDGRLELVRWAARAFCRAPMRAHAPAAGASPDAASARPVPFPSLHRSASGP